MKCQDFSTTCFAQHSAALPIHLECQLSAWARSGSLNFRTHCGSSLSLALLFAECIDEADSVSAELDQFSLQYGRYHAGFVSLCSAR